MGLRQAICAQPEGRSKSGLFLRSEVQRAELPAGAIFALEILIGLWHVGDAHVGWIVVNFLSGAQSNDAKEHDFGELRGVIERAGSFGFAFCCVYPIQFMILALDARQCLRWLGCGVRERLRQKARVEAIGVMHQLALAADDHDAAIFVHFLVFTEFFRLRRQEATVVPRQVDGRHFSARREFKESLRGVRERNFVERRANGFDTGGQAELERPKRNVEQVRAHVADRTATPINPAAPVERMIDRVIGDLGSDAEEEIPRESFRYRIISGERCGETLVYAVAVPLKTVGGNGQRFWTRNALWPEAERTIGPYMNFADFADGAGLDVFDGKAG